LAGRRAAGSASLVVLEGATPLRPELALFEEMLEGWARQQRARRLSAAMVAGRERVVRRFQESTGTWPWHWRPEQVERWVSAHNWAHSTVRNYEGALGTFMGYLVDERYGWAEICRRRLGAVPSQICHEDNTAVHVSEYEGNPRRRPLSRDELQAFFDAADERVGMILAAGRKGALSAFRDATLFKVTYAWGLRRREAAMLDVGDFRVNPAAPELGRYGVCHVRWGKAMRGSPPRRREVFTLMPWVVEALAQYIEEVRPLYEAPGPELWPTERGGRISARHVDERFASLRRAAGLPDELSVHCLRHSYISHCIEDGVDPLLVQQQAGHSWASTTAVYTTVGSDYKQRMMRAALERAFGRPVPGAGPGKPGREKAQGGRP
jgi:integrase/recombinase XerC